MSKQADQVPFAAPEVARMSTSQYLAGVLGITCAMRPEVAAVVDGMRLPSQFVVALTGGPLDLVQAYLIDLAVRVRVPEASDRAEGTPEGDGTSASFFLPLPRLTLGGR